MVEYSNQPKNDDLVLGSQAATPSQAVVLGGLEGVRSRAASWVNSLVLSQDWQTLFCGHEDAMITISKSQ